MLVQYDRRHSPWGRQGGNYPRCAIRQISGFKPVSDEAVVVSAKAIPILTDEMRRIYFSRLEHPEQIAAIKVEERRSSMHK